MRTITKSVYKFAELTDAAKEKARDWFRRGQFDHDWWDHVYEDADTIAAILGIELDRKRGGTSPTIWFSGFASQGDGACFEGRYAFKADAPQAIRAHAGKDDTLHNIADGLAEVQALHGNRLEARVIHRGHYYHKYCTEIDVTDAESGDNAPDDTAKTVAELLRNFMQWIYDALQSEHDFQSADAQVDESIEANEYEFYEDGKRCSRLS